ncbi:MAG: hypothetical protein LBL48_08275 [Azoarcus sp.]|jgi:hypothetical protein|nr:hypothetical protein [Azoarcus sp.]
MMPALLACLGYGLAITLILARCAPWLRARPERMTIALAAVCALLYLPVAGVSLLAVLRGALGDLSIVTLVFLLSILFLRGPRPLLPHAGFFALMGLAFFFLSFGLLPLDLYALGYASAVLPCLTGGLAFLLWLRGWIAPSLALLAALAGWRLHWLDSTNLWDYLLDVPLVVVASSRAAFSRIARKPVIKPVIQDAVK